MQRHERTIPQSDGTAGYDPATIEWLLTGDPAIRWQTQRDLLDAPAETWQHERQRTLTEGWGGRLLSLQEPDGRWGGGIYSPKWISTTYTLLTLCDIGIPATSPQAVRGARIVMKELLGEWLDAAFRKRLSECDTCIVGMVLRIGVYYGIDDERIPAIVEHLLAERMLDGGWNCRRHRRPRPSHSSFHTTLNVLEGLREYLEARDTSLIPVAQLTEQAALGLLFQHRLYRSDKTGKIIREEFANPVYPYRWHYDYLRGLAYVARAGKAPDPRLDDPIALLQRQQHDGRWMRGKQYSGRVFFTMEPVGPSRWNTLRALRVLRWWQEAR
jgi:hypothetical protein